MSTGPQQVDGLQPVASLQEFFRDSVDSAMAANRVVLDEQASHYVVCLLTLFARSEDFYEVGEDGLQLRPLALMLADAAGARQAPMKLVASLCNGSAMSLCSLLVSLRIFCNVPRWILATT